MTRKRIRLDELSKKAMDFCFGKHCIYDNPEDPTTCKLVVDKRSQQPSDYCPIVKFLNWLEQDRGEHHTQPATPREES